MKALGLPDHEMGGLLIFARSKERNTGSAVHVPHHSEPHHLLPVSKFTYEKTTNGWRQQMLSLTVCFCTFTAGIFRKTPHFVVGRPSASCLAF